MQPLQPFQISRMPGNVVVAPENFLTKLRGMYSLLFFLQISRHDKINKQQKTRVIGVFFFFFFGN